jgi:hypothetical protein
LGPKAFLVAFVVGCCPANCAIARRSDSSTTRGMTGCALPCKLVHVGLRHGQHLPSLLCHCTRCVALARLNVP